MGGLFGGTKIGTDGTPDMDVFHGASFNSDGTPNVTVDPKKIGAGISDSWKGATGGLGGLNPLNNKMPKPNIPDVNPAGIGGITAPAAPTGPGPQIAAPGTFTGGKIAPVAGPTAATVAVTGGDANAFRQAQLNAINGLNGMANGTAPSVAAQAAQAQSQRNIAAQYALANSTRGGYSPGAARAAMQNAATMNTDSVQQAAQAQLSERLQAAGLVGQIGGTGYGQDIDIAKTQAGLTQGATLAGYQGGIQSAIAQGSLDQDTAKTMYTTAAQQGIAQAQVDMAYNQLLAKYADMGLDASKANSAAATQLQSLIQSGALGKAQIESANHAANNSMIGNTLGGLGGFMGGIGTLMGAAKKTTPTGGGWTSIEENDPSVSTGIGDSGAANFMGPASNLAGG